MLNNKISFDIILFMSNIILVDEKIDSIYTGYLESLNYKIVKIIRNEAVYLQEYVRKNINQMLK